MNSISIAIHGQNELNAVNTTDNSQLLRIVDHHLYPHTKSDGAYLVLFAPFSHV